MDRRPAYCVAGDGHFEWMVGGDKREKCGVKDKSKNFAKRMKGDICLKFL